MPSIEDRLLKRSSPIQSLAGAAGRFGTILATGKAPSDPNQDLMAKLQYKALAENLEPKDGYDNPDQIPQELGGLPLKGITQRKGRYVPTYGKPSFFGFDPNQFGDEPDANEAAALSEPVESSQENPALAQLEEAYKASLSDPTVDRADVERIYKEERARLMAGAETTPVRDDDFEGDLSEFEIDETDREYLISLGYTPEDVDLALGSAKKRRTGGV